MGTNSKALLLSSLRTAQNFNTGAVGYEQSDYCITLLQRPVSVDVKQIHAHITKVGLLSSSVTNKLVILYCKNSGLVDAARQVFEEIPHKTVHSYATLIGSYSRLLQWGDVISVFGLMVQDSIEPDKFLVPTILKASAAMEALRIGSMVHAFVIRKKLELDVFIGNSLIDLYAKCGKLSSARKVFNMMAERDVVSWTALVAAYYDAGLLDEAGEVFESMQINGVKPDLISWNAMISGLAQNGEIDMALQCFEEMQEKGFKPNINSWNGIFSGCVQNGYFEDALDLFYEMLLSKNPNAVTIASILPACLHLRELNLGREMHSFVIKRELTTNIFVGGSLVNMYSKCGRSDYAERVFSQMERKNTAICNEMIAAYVNDGKMKEALELLHQMRIDALKPDLITYNTILAGYAREGKKDDALKLLQEMLQVGLKPNVVSVNVLISGFQQFGLSIGALYLFRIMQLPNEIVANNSNLDGNFPVEFLDEPLQPNAITITSALSACSNLSLQCQGKEIHAYILRNMFESNPIVSGALVDMYSKCEDMDSAAKTFDSISDKNIVSWNILMAGYNSNRDPEATLRLFPRMLNAGFTPNLITLMILLSACSKTSALRLGRELHGHIEKSGFNSAVTIACGLIDMYAKCGSILEAGLVFNYAIEKDATLCSAMISRYSMHGMGDADILEEMQDEMINLSMKYYEDFDRTKKGPIRRLSSDKM